MYFFLKYIVTLFYEKLRMTNFVCLLRESGPWLASCSIHYQFYHRYFLRQQKMYRPSNIPNYKNYAKAYQRLQLVR